MKEGDRWVGKQGRLQDFNSAIRLVLSTVYGKAGDLATSHGLKATMLSWCCAFGISEDFRAALGYHVGKQKAKTVWVYARDRQAAPLNEVDRMMADIRTGAFDPDEGQPFLKQDQVLPQEAGAAQEPR
eukprot:6449889-Karenia_brevis.AAC.1